MRFLKNKIRKSVQAAERRQQQGPVSPSIKLEQEDHSIISAQISLKAEENIKKEFIKDEEPQVKTEIIPDQNLKIEKDFHALSTFDHHDGGVSTLHSSALDLSVQYCNKEEAESYSPENTTTIKSKSNKNYMKNIDLNYIKAIINFVNSHIALPYLKAYLQQENLKFTTFVNFMSQSKECAQNGIQAFRAMILNNHSADENLIACKKILKQLSEVFIKYFSVNWIMHSKINSKEAYLKYRFQMLRKIQNPERYFNQGRKKSD